MGDSDDDSNSGVIIGVVVSLVVIIFIVVAAVIIAFIWHRHTKQRKYPHTTAGPSETTQSNGANGLASRPTTIQLKKSSQTPLLNLTGPNAYTDTATLPQPIDGAPMPYGNASNGINNDGDDVSDSDLDKNTDDFSVVDI